MASLATSSEKQQHLYLPSDFVHFSLPYRQVSFENWVRVNGNYSVTVTAGPIQRPDGTTETFVPYGKYARAALMYLCTQAKLKDSAKVCLHNSYYSYLQEIGIPWNGHNAVSAIRQLQAITACSITLSSIHEDGLLVNDKRFSFSKESSLLFHDKKGNLNDQHNSYIILNDDLFSEISKTGIPFNKLVIHRLLSESKSPMTLDIYCWLSARLYQSKIAHISWDQLFDQFGSGGSIKKFRQNFMRGVAQAKHFYPEANISFLGDGRKGFHGVLLQPSENALQSHYVDQVAREGVAGLACNT